VVLISYINEVCARGTLPFREAVMEGARRRLRPVTLTASIAALGLVPFLFADGPGAEIQRPLATVLIGGLITATALTLLLVPILYDRLALPRAERRRLAELEACESDALPPAVTASGATGPAHRHEPDRPQPVGEPAAVAEARPG
jgi:cobalt-zinc-cadmium resistance protein CzcA